MTMITPSYLGETIEYSSLHACRSTLEDPIQEVEDSAVTEAVKALQDRRALIEPATRPAQVGDQVKVHVNATITHPESEGHDHEESEHEEHEGHEHEHHHGAHTEPYMDDDADVVLVENVGDDEVMPGFTQNLVGLSAGEEKTFTLSFPEDHKESQLAAHTFTFNVKVEEVKSRTLPVLNDEFAKLVTEGEKETLLDLRIDVRKQLEVAAKSEAETKYADQVLDKVAEQATVKYPEEMLQEYTDDILQNLDRQLRERGLSLDEYKKFEKKDDAAMRADYRDAAIRRLKRALILGEIVSKEQLNVSDADVLAQIDKMSAQFGEQASVFRQMLMRPETQNSIAMDLLTNRAMERLIAVARGENPPVGPTPTAAIEPVIADTAVAEPTVMEAVKPEAEVNTEPTTTTSEAEPPVQTEANTEAPAAEITESAPTETETPATSTE